MKWAIDCSAALGSEILAGPYHQPLGFFRRAAYAKEKEYAAKVHQDAADYAKQVSTQLSIEPLNRFECYFLNIGQDASDYVDLVDRDNFGYLYDTFHANIEEKDPVGVISKTIKNINHIHISENDRGTPGKGNIPWIETFDAIKLRRWLVDHRGFCRALPDLAATRVWRDFFLQKKRFTKKVTNLSKIILIRFSLISNYKYLENAITNAPTIVGISGMSL